MAIQANGYARRATKQGSAGYYVPKMIGFVLCNACLDIVLENSEKARELCNEVIESFRLPDCQEALSRLQRKIPEGRELLEALVKRSSSIHREQGLLKGSALLQGGMALAEEYLKEFRQWVDLSKGRIKSKDFGFLFGRVKELIKVGFNKESEQAKGKYKVEGSSLLFFTVGIRALSEHYKLQLQGLGRVEIVRVGGKTYDIEDLANDELTVQARRYLVPKYRGDGFVLRHKDKLDSTAWRWYQCRVVYSGPEEFCRKLYLAKGENLDPANVSNEIRECDEAIGYMREQTGKRKMK